jgi:PAS domain S-box-containing protein
MKTSWVYRAGHAATWIILLAGPFLGWAAFQAGSDFENERAQISFETYLSDRAALLQREAYDIAVDLYYVRGFFSSKRDVTRAEFRTFTREVLEGDPSIRALLWAPRVDADRRRENEGSGQAEGSRGNRIHGSVTGDAGATPPPQKESYPVLYAEPFAPNEHLAGFDLLSEDSPREALALAAKTKRIAFTDPRDLFPGKGSPKGILAVLPVYLEQADGRPEHPAQPDGYVAVLLAVREIVGESLLLGGGRPRIQFQLADTDVAGKSDVIYATPDWNKGELQGGRVFERSIVLANQNWQLLGRPTSLFLSEQRTGLPLALGAGVFLFWETLSGLGLSLAKQVRDRALREQEHLYGSVWRSLAEGVIVAGPDGRFLLFNDSAKRTLGIGLVNVDQEEWSSTYGCFYPDSITPYPSDQLPLARAIRGEEVRDVEIFIRNPQVPDGVWVSVSASPLVDENDDPAGGVVVFYDITAAKKANQALKQSLKELEDMKYAFDQAAIVAVTDPEGSLIYVNDKFCEISGYAREELLGRNHNVVNSGCHPKSFFDDLWKTISEGRIWRRAMQNRSKNGNHYWVDTTIVPFLSDHGKPERYMTIQTDITERRREQETLERLYNAVDQTADAVFITNRDGVIEYVNPSFETTTGYSRTEALGRTPRILKSGIHDSDFYRRLWQKILHGEVFQATTTNRRKNGELYYAGQTITPMKDLDGHVTHFVSVLRDVTERIRMQEREIEMHYASLVQKKLYPEAAPQIDGFDIAGAVFPAEATSGDYFDYLRMAKGELGVAIGDVCGHGLGPALIMAETRAYVRSLALRRAELHEMLGPINDWLNADLEEGSYVTLLLARIDISSKKLVYTNAGHTPGYLISGSGELKAVLQSTGFPLGMFPESRYGSGEDLVMASGDLLVLITDGIPEAESPDGEAFQEKRLLEVIRAHLEEPAELVVRHVERAIHEFTGGAKPSDDLTIVVCKAVS